MATLLLVSCLLGSLFTSCTANSISQLSTVQKSVPKISFYPCVVPTVRKLQFCCVTENIHTATVHFYRESDKIATIQYPCDVNTRYSDFNVSCKSVGTTTVMYLDVLGFNHQTDPTLFGCRYYGKSAGYNLFSSHILTDNKGYQFTNITQNSTLTWNNTNNNFTIVNPAGEIIMKGQNSAIDVTGNKSKISYSKNVFMGTFSLNLYNTKKEDNGTYVYVTNSNSNRSGITLVVLDKLDLPIIQNITTSLSSGKIWANMSCTAEQKSGAPLFYRPTFEVVWKYPLDASYSVIQNGSNLILEEVDCSSDNSQPLFCSVRELKGSYSDSQHFYPHTLCTYKPVTVPPPSEDEKNGGLIAGVVILSLLCAVLLIIAYCGKDKVKKCCRSMCGLCRQSPFCICRKCMKDDLDFDIHEPRFQMPHGDFGRHDDLDWRQILDLYSGDHPPTVPPPRPMLSTPRPDQYLPPPRPEALQGMSSSDNTVTFENDESGIDNPDFQDDEETVNGDDITVSDVSTLGATGVDHSTLVREVETCLSHLKKLLNSTENQVQVRRDNIIEDLINIYTDPTILQSYLHINVLGEPGSDWGGVSRDIFTSFWNEATALYFKGNDVHVPYLPPHKMEEERNFLLMGRILAHSTAILGYIPISICKSCMMVTIFNTTHIESNTLLEDFLLFVDLKDRNLIQSALNNFSGLSEDQKEDLQNLFYQFEMGCILKEETFRDQLLNMARNELVLKPRSLCERLRLGIPEVHFDQFWSQMTIDHISILHARLKPTPEKVVKCLKLAEPLRLLDMKRRKVFQYFKDFIEQLGDEDLQKFLQFITGQNCVPKRTISVQFSNLSGAERRPVAHTCGYLIEIPEAYDNYTDFETEFRNVLQSDILRFDVQ